MLQRLDETKRPHLASAVPRGFHAIFLASSFPLCKRSPRRSLSYSFTHFHRSLLPFWEEFSVSARLCLGAPCRVHDADCDLYHL